MDCRILITGSAGLVGTALRTALEARGARVVGIDLAGIGDEEGDVREAAHIRGAVARCEGVVHLAAVSRVIWGERDPERCWSTNVGGLRNVVEATQLATRRPWLIFASSREVYGQPGVLPATEETPLQPVNVYGRSKLEGERIVQAAREWGLRAAIVRLSNVYGSSKDHADRVVPAFARAAVRGAALRVQGAAHTFDFTHLDDTTRGLVALIDLLAAGGAAPPPIHFLTGHATSLGELASLAVQLAGGRASIRHALPRSFDVSQFHGSPARAGSVLGWAPRVTLPEGLRCLIDDLRAELGAPRQPDVAP
jgi:nucleoside-diphosphate-sugar epimerase